MKNKTTNNKSSHIEQYNKIAKRKFDCPILKREARQRGGVYCVARNIMFYLLRGWGWIGGDEINIEFIKRLPENDRQLLLEAWACDCITEAKQNIINKIIDKL